MTSGKNVARKRTTRSFWQYFREKWQLYLLMTPAIVLIIVFAYVPMYGIQIAFKDFIFSKGILGSKFVGMYHFSRFFHNPNFRRVIVNTLGISLYSMALGFPMPILLAIMINETRNQKFKKTVQMITYAPYFISQVAMCGMVLLFLKKDNGVINAIIEAFGGERSDLISNPRLFWHIYVLSGVWQYTGWNSIIYIAALSSVSPNIVEAAIIDGASRFKKIIHIDIPTILPTIVILLILNVGQLLGVGSEKVLLLQNSLNLERSETISTYIYRQGIVGSKYDYATAVGLFNSVINAFLLLIANRVAKQLGETSLW